MGVIVANYIKNIAGGGKFVVMTAQHDPDEGVMAFSDFTRDFQHHDIVVRWEKANAAAIASLGMRITGGGWWKMEGERLILYGRSAAYGRFNPEWVRKVLRPGMVAGEKSVVVQ